MLIKNVKNEYDRYLKDKLKIARDSGYHASLTHNKLVIANAEGKRNMYKYDAVTNEENNLC